MNITKRVISIAATFSLALSGLVALSAPANAADQVPNMYGLNIANQSSTGDAKDFVKAPNGKTYFVVNTLTYGKSIWSLADDAAGTVPELVTDVAQGNQVGWPFGLAALGDYIFFWDVSTDSNGGTAAYMVNVNTKVRTELKDENGIGVRAEESGNFAEVNGKVYFYYMDYETSEWKLQSWDQAGVAGETVRVDGTNLTFRPEGKMFGWDGKLYISQLNTVYYWQGNPNNKLHIYDPATSAWSTLQDSNSNEISGTGLYGVYKYNGADVLITKGFSSGSTKYFYIPQNAAGVASPIGTWSKNVDFFINIGSELFVRDTPAYGDSYVLNKVSTADGSLISQNETMFPGKASVRIVSPSSNGTKLFFAGLLSGESKEHLYMWDGSTAATQIGSLSAMGGSEYFAEYPASGGWSRNESSGLVGNSGILNLSLDDNIGYEPYLIHPDGTYTLVKDFNTGSEGSNPDLSCTFAGTTSDFMVGSLPMLGTRWGKDVLVKAVSDGTNLGYKVIDPGTDVRNMCGFAEKGTDVYFTASDNNSDALFKINSTGVVTRIGDLDNPAQKAWIVGNKYYYLSDNNYDIWVVDFTNPNSLVQTQLTGSPSSGIYDDSVNSDDMVQSGTKLFFTAEDKTNSNDHIYMIDMAATTYKENLVGNITGAVDHNPQHLTVLGTNLYFTDQPAWQKSQKLYKMPLAGGAVTKIWDFGDSNNDYVNQVKSAGSDLYVSFRNNTANKLEIHKFASGSTHSLVALPNNDQPYCMTTLNGGLLASAQDGSAYIYKGTSVTNLDYQFEGNDYSVCNAVPSARGLYTRVNEYFYQNGPWDYEFGYFGNLTPIAVSRFGQDVNEGPASPIDGTLPSTNDIIPGVVSDVTATVANNVINLSWTAPTTGTTPRYVVSSSPAGAVCAVTLTGATCTGAGGTSYTFTVKAGNTAGLSAGVTSAAVVAPGSAAVLDPEDPSVGLVDETKTLKGISGSVTFPDGSGFDVDSKGRIFSKIKSKFLTSSSGTIKVTYGTKTFTCVVKAFGSIKKLKKAPTKGIVSKTKKPCQLPAAAFTALKTNKVVIKQTLTVKRLWATTAKAKTPANKTIKPMTRKMTVTMGKKA